MHNSDWSGLLSSSIPHFDLLRSFQSNRMSERSAGKGRKENTQTDRCALRVESIRLFICFVHTNRPSAPFLLPLRKYEKVRGRSRTIKMVWEGRRRKVVGVLKGTEKLQHRWEAHKSTEERDERVAQKEGGSDQQGGASPGGKAQPSPGEESPTPHLTDTHLLPASFSLTIHPSINEAKP
ncbi:hypothetical protein niasHT_015894 [Heterodera trifolii]|uniref:Uncharacterized protein n=1 Tax=Heterodera trifolii TaxID=157864 RepID=A0ABD2LKD7_9BILA